MPLSDTAIRAARPSSKPIKLADERGLFLLLQPSGGKLWRLKYRIHGKEKKLSLGRYSDVSLKEARSRRDDARASLAKGIDPREERKRARQEMQTSTSNSFQTIAEEYLEKFAAEDAGA